MSRALLALGDVIGISTLTGAVKADDLELEVIRGFGVCIAKKRTDDIMIWSKEFCEIINLQLWYMRRQVVAPQNCSPISQSSQSRMP